MRFRFLKTSAVFFITLTLVISPFPAHGAEESPVLTACEDSKPVLEGDISKNQFTFKAGDTEIDSEELKKDGIGDREFRGALQKANNAYHRYVQCLFDEATNVVIPNFVTRLGEKAQIISGCIPQEELVATIQSTSPEVLLEPLLSVREAYGIFMREMYSAYKAHRSDLVSPQSATSNTLWFSDYINRELRTAAVALDTAFIQLKELRSSYMFHVHLSCMAENLSKYRDMVKKIRSQILDLEPRLDSASMTCPAN